MSFIKSNIPQSPPFEMVDGVNADAGIARLCILSTNILVEKGSFSTAGLVEHMAQSIAALGSNPAAKIPTIGFIASISKCSIQKNPVEGDIIETRIETIMSNPESQVVKAFCSLDGMPIAEAQFSIFLQAEA